MYYIYIYTCYFNHENVLMRTLVWFLIMSLVWYLMMSSVWFLMVSLVWIFDGEFGMDF